MLKNDYVKAREITEDLKFCMMTTETPEGRLVSRPMTCLQLDEEGYLWFFASQESEQTIAFDFDENVNLAFACPEKSHYLSIVGTAEVRKDADKVEELWKPEFKEWFQKGKGDPRVCLIRVHALHAEYWDGPSVKSVKLFENVKTPIDGEAPRAGESAYLN